MASSPRSDWFDKDFYAILGVAHDADAATIKKTYRKLARKLHPDQNAGDGKAEAKFKEIGEAYSVLSDPEQRQQYDQIRTMARGGARFTAGGSGSAGQFEDIFSGMFNGGAGGGARPLRHGRRGRHGPARPRRPARQPLRGRGGRGLPAAAPTGLRRLRTAAGPARAPTCRPVRPCPSVTPSRGRRSPSRRPPVKSITPASRPVSVRAEIRLRGKGSRGDAGPSRAT